MDYEHNNATEKVENITGENAEQEYRQAEYDRENAAYARLQEKEEKADEKAERIKMREEYRKGSKAFGGGKGKSGNKTTGWAIAVVVLGSLALIFGTLFTISVTKNTDGGKTISGSVDRAYYNLVNYVDSMDVDMSKLIVSNDKKQQQRILTELSAKAMLAAEDISRLPMKDESKFYTTKFVNQVGDYSKYLNNKLIDGLSVTNEDKDNLKSLYEINGTLKTELTKTTADMGADYDFMTLLDDTAGNILLDKFDELESNATDYPKLIYDGPFSDGLDEKSPKGLDGEAVSLAKAMEIVEQQFISYGLTEMEPEGEGKGFIETYNFNCKTEDEGGMYVELSKIGGKVINFECYRDCTQQKLSLDDAEQVAEKFLDKMGFKDMKAVWATEKGAVAYLNFVYTINGVAIYPDMVKVTVCKERGVVSSMDAREYYLNHTVRSLETPKLTAEQAKDTVSENIDIETCRLAVVPYGQSKEALTYEISGKVDGATYYVYVDAVDGREINIFRVVETTEGMLV